MQYSDYLTEIAALIKENPSITVREIAAELKFADSKSVYYWLEKSNIGGIKEFKRLVLKEETAYGSSFALEIGGKVHYGIKVPLFSWNVKQKKPQGEWRFFYHQRRPQGLFAVRVGTNAFSPWFSCGDILLVRESTSFQEGDWLLVGSPREYLLGRALGGRTVDFRDLESYPPSYILKGVLLRQERYFSP